MSHLTKPLIAWTKTSKLNNGGVELHPKHLMEVHEGKLRNLNYQEICI